MEKLMLTVYEVRMDLVKCYVLPYFRDIPKEGFHCTCATTYATIKC